MRITHIGPLSVAKVAFVFALFGASLGAAVGEESPLLGEAGPMA